MELRREWWFLLGGHEGVRGVDSFVWEGCSFQLFLRLLIRGTNNLRFFRSHARLSRRQLTSTRARRTIRIMQLFRCLKQLFLSSTRSIIRRKVFRHRNRIFIRHLLSSQNFVRYRQDHRTMNRGRATHPRFGATRVARRSSRRVNRLTQIGLPRSKLSNHTQELSIIINPRVLPFHTRRVNVARITNVMVFLLMLLRGKLRFKRHARQRHGNGRLTTLLNVSNFHTFLGNLVNVFLRHFSSFE